jgi:predicted HNH restriction endonuclease
VHHLRPIAGGGDLVDFDNLMAVCAGCHENMHWQLREGYFWCSMLGEVSYG